MQSTSNTSPKKPFPFVRQAKPAWAAMGGLAIFTVLGILLGAGSLVRFIFPLASLAIGLFLYSQYSILYIGFTWWLWFLTPLISRIIDLQSGWDPSRLILVAPFLVTLISTITLVKYLPKNFNQDGLPFLLVLAAIGYGAVIGLINNQPVGVARSILDWFTPLPFAFHLWINWREYPQYKKVIQDTFLWGVLIMGIYGIIQYFIAPEWDRYWLIQSGMFSSSGSAEALEMRIWSTMHSPGPFATTMRAGLLLLFTHKNPVRLPAAIAGALSLLVSLVRASWGGFILAMIIFIPSLKSKIQLRIISTMLILGLCIIPLTMVEPFASRIGDRVLTFTQIQEDNSFKARQENYEENLMAALSTFQGRGLGNTWSFSSGDEGLSATVIDSGILDLFSTLGWVGATFYLSGLILSITRLIKSARINHDIFLSALRAFIIATCAAIVISTVMISVSGILLWCFIGISLAGNKFHLRYKSQNKS